MTHTELVNRAANWLRGQKCQCVLSGPNRWNVPEIPDAIGWRYGVSMMVECKSLYADFRADARKPWRTGQQAALGTVRYYMAPKDLAEKIHDMIPPKWGLLVALPRTVKVVVRPEVWPHEMINYRGELHILAGGYGWELKREEIRAEHRRKQRGEEKMTHQETARLLAEACHVIIRQEEDMQEVRTWVDEKPSMTRWAH